MLKLTYYKSLKISHSLYLSLHVFFYTYIQYNLLLEHSSGCHYFDALMLSIIGQRYEQNLCVSHPTVNTYHIQSPNPTLSCQSLQLTTMTWMTKYRGLVEVTNSTIIDSVDLCRGQPQARNDRYREANTMQQDTAPSSHPKLYAWK